MTPNSGISSPLTPNSTRSHTPPDPTYEQPTAKRRSTTTCCIAECGRTLEPPMPTPRPPAGRGRVHGMQLPSPVRLLPPCQNDGHRSRHSQHLHPLPPPQSATVPESRQPSTRESCAQATALHSRTRWQGVVQLLRGKCTPVLNRSRLLPATCTAAHAQDRRGGPQPAVLRQRERLAPRRFPATGPPAQPKRNPTFRE